MALKTWTYELKRLKELSKQGLLNGYRIEDLVFCKDCVLGKSTRASFKPSVHTSGGEGVGALEYIYSEEVSLGGAKYFLSIIDDYSKIVWVYLLKQKDQVFDKFKE